MLNGKYKIRNPLIPGFNLALSVGNIFDDRYQQYTQQSQEIGCLQYFDPSLYILLNLIILYQIKYIV